MVLRTIAPKDVPTVAVAPIASAPEKVTRAAPVNEIASPTLAAIEPKTAKKTSELPDITNDLLDIGATVTRTTGSAAVSVSAYELTETNPPP